MEQGCVQKILSDDVMCHMYGNDKGEYDDMKKGMVEKTGIQTGVSGTRLCSVGSPFLKCVGSIWALFK